MNQYAGSANCQANSGPGAKSDEVRESTGESSAAVRFPAYELLGGLLLLLSFSGGAARAFDARTAAAVSYYSSNVNLEHSTPLALAEHSQLNLKDDGTATGGPSIEREGGAGDASRGQMAGNARIYLYRPKPVSSPRCGLRFSYRYCSDNRHRQCDDAFVAVHKSFATRARQLRPLEAANQASWRIRV